MKITFLVSHLLCGGAERTVTYLSSFMAENGWDVTVLTISNNVFYTLNPKVKLVSLDVPLSGGGVVTRVCNAFRRKKLINRYLKENPPDILFCMLYQTAKYVLSFCRRTKIKLITSERNNPASVTAKNEISLRTKIFSASDAIVFQTERARSYYPEGFQKKGTVIFNAVGNDLVYKCPIPKKRDAKICAIGRLHPQKDYPTLLRAFRKVVNKYPDYILEIYGSGSEKEKLILLANELDIDKNVSFMGARTDAIIQASSASCYVMSSAFEGMPNALLEAMAVGLPCVSTDCPNGPAELIEDGVNGILVPVGDDEKLAEAILKMLDDKDFAELCGNRAREILKSHSVEFVARKYSDFIAEVIKKEF